MKLRNKKTGEIVEVLFGNYKNQLKSVVIDNDNEPGEPYGIYNSLAELNKDWEDYKDKPCVIDMWEEDCICDAKFGVELEGIERAKELGIWFKTEEETEKAVEKFKARKRLENKGFRFTGLGVDHYEIDDIKYEMEEPPTTHDCQEMKDLKLLFGGEE